MIQAKLNQDWGPIPDQIEIHEPYIQTMNDLPENFETVNKRRRTQKEVIMDLLQNMDWVPTEMIIDKGIYQYNARIHELRKKGNVIESVRIKGRYGFRLIQ
jgi:predicted transcriptional regulator